MFRAALGHAGRSGGHSHVPLWGRSSRARSARGLSLIVLVAASTALSAIAASATTLHAASSATGSRTVERSKTGGSAAVRDFRPRFHRTAAALIETSLDGTVLLADGPAYTASPAPNGGTLIAENGSSYSVSPPPDCLTTLTRWPVVGAGTALYDCRSSADDVDPNYEISTPPSDVWSPVTGSAIASLCAGPQYTGGSCAVVALGRAWIELRVQPSRVPGFSYRLVSVATGAVVNDPTAGNVIVDLNAADPARRRCSGLHATPGGLVRSVGHFAVVATPSAPNAQIQRCNSAQTIRLRTAGVAANANAIVWAQSSNDTVIRGIQAHTGQHFTITIPGPLRHQLFGLAITKTSIYVSGNILHPRVWTAPLPAPLAAPRG